MLKTLPSILKQVSRNQLKRYTALSYANNKPAIKSMSHYDMNHSITKKTIVLTFKSASLFTNALQRSLVVHPLVSALPL